MAASTGAQLDPLDLSSTAKLTVLRIYGLDILENFKFFFFHHSISLMPTMSALSWWLLAALLMVACGIEDLFTSHEIKNSERLFGSPKMSSNTPAFEANRYLDGDGDFTSYLVDRNGDEYEPYSLAWRYLGMYIDCDIDEQQVQDERRFLQDGDGDNCERVLLWAAVSR